MSTLKNETPKMSLTVAVVENLKTDDRFSTISVYLIGLQARGSVKFSFIPLAEFATHHINSLPETESFSESLMHGIQKNNLAEQVHSRFNVFKRQRSQTESHYDGRRGLTIRKNTD